MFSIILPLYNKESSIESTILSVLNQTLIDFELIVVDDGSKDQSIHLVRNIKDKRLSIYCKENGGVSSARNLGISKAKFEYICFIDGDDIWESTYLQKMSELISLYPKAGIYGSAWAYRYRDKIVTPFSDFIYPYAFSPFTSKVTVLIPAISPSRKSSTWIWNPLRSAHLLYIRYSILAQSQDSVPPAPAWIVTMALQESYSPDNRV